MCFKEIGFSFFFYVTEGKVLWRWENFERVRFRALALSSHETAHRWFGIFVTL